MKNDTEFIEQIRRQILSETNLYYTNADEEQNICKEINFKLFEFSGVKNAERNKSFCCGIYPAKLLERWGKEGLDGSQFWAIISGGREMKDLCQKVMIAQGIGVQKVHTTLARSMTKVSPVKFNQYFPRFLLARAKRVYDKYNAGCGSLPKIQMKLPYDKDMHMDIRSEVYDLVKKGMQDSDNYGMKNGKNAITIYIAGGQYATDLYPVELV